MGMGMGTTVVYGIMVHLTQACDDSNSKLVEVVAIADIDDEDLVGSSLLKIWKLKFGQKALLTFVQTLSTRFGQDFDVGCCCLVEVGKYNLGQNSEAVFAQNSKFKSKSILVKNSIKDTIYCQGQ